MLALPALPLIRPSASTTSSTEPFDATTGKRKDGRLTGQLRPLKLRTGVVTSASGSAMLELAHTKVLCSVFGPHQAEGREYMQQGQLECTVRLASFARRGACRTRAGGPSVSTEERALSLDLAAALAPSVQLHLLPKSVVAVHVLVLQDDGGVLSAAVSCASLALADATIGLYGMVAAVGGGMLGEAVALDCDAAELDASVGSLTVACMPALDQLTLLRHEGAVPFERAIEGLQLGLEGCSLLHGQMAAALRKAVEARARQAVAAEARAAQALAHHVAQGGEQPAGEAPIADMEAVADPSDGADRADGADAKVRGKRSRDVMAMKGGEAAR